MLVGMRDAPSRLVISPSVWRGSLQERFRRGPRGPKELGTHRTGGAWVPESLCGRMPAECLLNNSVTGEKLLSRSATKDLGLFVIAAVIHVTNTI